ncbi:hypothetical protein BJF78_21265 [Pseudonocardia sp. CNS-139]|nr:hypothetical protein BJF78_21265 [Pseudonocardia sp. CNS-139]
MAGVDVARGAALFGMMAAHVYDILDDQGAPTTATVVTAGRAAATFVLLAGVSLAFMSGGRHVVQGWERTAVAGGLVVRALLIGAIGLALGILGPLNDVAGILPFYAVLFLLAIPLLGWPPPVLAGVAAGVIVAGPVLLVATAEVAAPYDVDLDPTFGALVHDPPGLLVQLFVTGEYPVVVYLAYICAGLAIGRLDLTSRRVGWWLFGAGTALAVAARLTSDVLLYRLGGLAALVAQGQGAAAGTVETLLWDPDPPTSWWYLALPAPHSHTPVDLVHTLGSAMAVLGAALLLTRVRVLARALSPLAAAGSMVLTLYSAHLVLLATGVLREQPGLLLVLMIVGAAGFAVLWRRRLGQGPLERVVAAASGATRRRLADRLARRPATGARRATAARAVQVLVPLACASALVLGYWAGTRLGPDREEEPPASDAAARPGPEPVENGGAPDLGRYCQLSEQVAEVEEQHPDDPKAVVGKADVQLTDMPRVAPVEIRPAVTVLVTDIRAEAGEPTAGDQDDAALQQAEATVDSFEDLNCP